MDIVVKQLPSGFWAVWVGSDWVEASFPNEKTATEYAEKLREVITK